MRCRVSSARRRVSSSFEQSAAIQRASMPQHDLRARLAQRMGHLQPQAARAAGDEGGLAGEVEEFLDGACGHGLSPGFG